MLNWSARGFPYAAVNMLGFIGWPAGWCGESCRPGNRTWPGVGGSGWCKDAADEENMPGCGGVPVSPAGPTPNPISGRRIRMLEI